MSLSPAEQKVRKLARLPGNCECANCGTYKKFGFSTVCIKFHTFVCNNCKSSHQAISHRCKSLTMSSWTDAEVVELEQKGNDYARRTWLKTAPPVGTGGRPMEGDHVDVFKRFVVDVYERKRYYGPDDGAGPALAAPQVITAVPLSHPPPPASAAPRTALRPVPGTVAQGPPPPAPVVDLIDFSSPSQINGNNINNNGVAFQANFDIFGSKPMPSTPPSSFQADFGSYQSHTNPKSSNSSSGFSFISKPPTAAPTPAPAPSPAGTTSGFAFISQPPAPPTNTSAPTTYANDFADFAGMSAPPPEPSSIMTGPKKSVMSNQGLNGKASMISSMSSLPSGMPQQSAKSFGMYQQQPIMQGNNMMMAQQQMMMQQQQPLGRCMNQMGVMNHAATEGMNMGGMNPAMGGMNMGGMNPAMGGMNMGGMNPAMGGMNMGGMNPAMGGMNTGGMNPAMGGMNTGGMNPAMGGINMGGMINPAMGGLGMGGGKNPMMAQQQQMMSFGAMGNNNEKSNNASSMHSLSMSSMSMNAWTTGGNKK